jgi:prevent-host-death family protein
MTTISLEQAQAKLPELIHRLGPGDEVVVTENDRPVARIVSSAPQVTTRKLGSMAGTVLFMADDFDAPLDEFNDDVT